MQVVQMGHMTITVLIMSQNKTKFIEMKKVAI